MKEKVIIVVLVLLLIFISSIRFTEIKCSREKIKIELNLKRITPQFLDTDTINKDLVMSCIKYYNLKFEKIVLAQAILETGNFTSNACIVNNNLFGIYYKGKLKNYTHWSNSIKEYKEIIQKRYIPPDDYYSFLRNIKYAKDIKYIFKLKKLVNNK